MHPIKKVDNIERSVTFGQNKISELNKKKGHIIKEIGFLSFSSASVQFVVIGNFVHFHRRQRVAIFFAFAFFCDFEMRKYANGIGAANADYEIGIFNRMGNDWKWYFFCDDDVVNKQQRR